MLKMDTKSLQEAECWKKAGIRLPQYDVAAMRKETEQNPIWVHFGAGNIFRGYIAKLHQKLLTGGYVKSGIIAVETFDFEIIDRIYDPYDAMTMLVSLCADGSINKEIIASIAKGLRGSKSYPSDMEALKQIFRNPGLQMVSLTITEKGYAVTGTDGNYLPAMIRDFAGGIEESTHVMNILTLLLYERFMACGAPVAIVSMDNCSKNGDRLKKSILTVAQEWFYRGTFSSGFLAWLSDESNVTFPWTMIDKITPRPSESVGKMLEALDIEDMSPVTTEKNTYIAPFVNAEEFQCLVVEDRFPNGRPPLERAGVYMTDRETVNKTERMKVTACLNPLHTALAVFGCLLGFDSISAEMHDDDLRSFVTELGVKEALPVVADPKIISPRAFLNTVLNDRLPNPFIPDTPQRIATDTSQKMAIRFGETIRSYESRPDLNVANLHCIPLVLAGWLRYLLAVDDSGKPMKCSADPMLQDLQKRLSSVKLGCPESATEALLTPLLSDATLFRVDLVETGLADRIIDDFRSMLAGPGAVRSTLQQILQESMHRSE